MRGGSFQLLTSTESAASSLECIYRHLAEGGFLLLDLFIPWREIKKQETRTFHVTRDTTRKDGWRSVVLERFKVDYEKRIKYAT